MWNGAMSVPSWILLSVITIVMFSNGEILGDQSDIGGGGHLSTGCSTTKRGWTYKLPVDFPSTMMKRLKRQEATLQHLKRRLHTTETLLEHLKRVVEYKTQDCSDIYHNTNGLAQSGVYTIQPTPTDPTAKQQRSVPVYCRMEAGRGWTVLQRRQDGSVNFYRTWEDYQRGFGNLTAEFWLGNDNIHLLTSQGRYKLRVDLETWGGETTYAEYDDFSTANETLRYKLTLGNYRGTAGDALQFSRGRAFSTWDRDASLNLVKRFKGACWCLNSPWPSLNGVYYTPDTLPVEQDRAEIKWLNFRDLQGPELIKFVEMKITKTS